jgi:hypothetical protein
MESGQASLEAAQELLGSEDEKSVTVLQNVGKYLQVHTR